MSGPRLSCRAAAVRERFLAAEKNRFRTVAALIPHTLLPYLLPSVLLPKLDGFGPAFLGEQVVECDQDRVRQIQFGVGVDDFAVEDLLE